MALPGGTKKHPLYKSFVFAFEGMITALKMERNMRIHAAAGTFMMILGFWFSLSIVEWLFLLLAIAGVLTLELLNSAVERTVDLAADRIHPLAKQAKDMAAGAVLVYSIFAVIIGLLIFVPKLV